VTDAPSQDRLQTLELRFIAALRDGDHETLERLLHADFSATEIGGEGQISRREFLRRAIYAEFVVPNTEPRWIANHDETPPGKISYRWNDAEGVEHWRGSWWSETDEGLRLRQYFAQQRAFNGGELHR
jgi:hypothetical protein